MSDGERQFIEELKQKLRHHQEQQEIILEYEHHIYEMKQELHVGETLSYEQITHRDRKSTRLNSSHVAISYAVFCLKKKKNMKNNVIIIVTSIDEEYS